MSCGCSREGEGGSNPGEGDEEAGGSDTAKRASGNGSEDGPASKKQKTADDKSGKSAKPGASACVLPLLHVLQCMRSFVECTALSVELW